MVTGYPHPRPADSASPMIVSMTGPGDAPPRFLTLADTADVLNISVGQAYGLVRSNELPAIKVGGHWRIERSVLESYIEAMYEESRRRSLWQQSDFASIPEVAPGQNRTTST